MIVSASPLETLFKPEQRVKNLIKEDTSFRLPMKLVLVLHTLISLCSVRFVYCVSMLHVTSYFTGVPIIANPPVDQFTISNANAIFVCDTLAFPEHTISWTFINYSGAVTEIFSDTSKYSIVANRSTTRYGELTVMNVDYRDRGVYTCTAINSIGSDMACANLTVHGELTFITSWDSQNKFLSCCFSLSISPDQ